MATGLESTTPYFDYNLGGKKASEHCVKHCESLQETTKSIVELTGADILGESENLFSQRFSPAGLRESK